MAKEYIDLEEAAEEIYQHMQEKEEGNKYPMKKLAYATETYETMIPGFIVDIVSKPDMYEAWLYHEKYGVKSMMFGMDKENISHDPFLEIVFCTLSESDYYLGYAEDYMDYDDQASVKDMCVVLDDIMEKVEKEGK